MSLYQSWGHYPKAVHRGVVPIVWRDDPRSHVRLVRDSGGMLLDLGRIRLNAWMGRYALSRVPSSPPERAT